MPNAAQLQNYTFGGWSRMQGLSPAIKYINILVQFIVLDQIIFYV